MSYASFIWANLRRRPVHNILGVVAATIAFTLYGLALGTAEGLRQAAAARHADIGQGFMLGALAVSAIGMALILFLTANAMAQSIRLRMAEFGLLKAIGFQHRMIMALVAGETALPCLAGALLGLMVAKLLFALLVALLPALAAIPAPVYTPALLAAAAALALFIGAASAALPASRIIRIEVASALREI